MIFLAFAAPGAPAGLEVLTLAHVIARLAGLYGQTFVIVETSKPQAVLGLGGGGRLLLANITPGPQSVHLPSRSQSITRIGFEGAALPAQGTVMLQPYDCVEIVL